MTGARPAAGGPLPTGNESWRYEVVGWASASAAGPGHVNGDRTGADGVLFTIADGVGSTQLGGRAAAAAVRAMHASTPFDRSSLESAVFVANNAVRELQHRSSLSGGATLTALLVAEAGAFVVSVGDSRAYMLTGDAGPPRQMTTDDNAAAAHGLTLGHPDYRRFSAQLTRCLGSAAILDTAAIEVPLLRSVVRILLTTDGVHDALVPEVLGDTAGTEDPGRAALALVSAAVDSGTADDATVLIVDLSATADGDREQEEGAGDDTSR